MIQKVIDLIKNEPVGFAYAIQALIAAGFGVLTAFDVWHPSEDQLSALMVLYIAFMAVLVMFVRGKVTPIETSGGTLASLNRVPDVPPIVPSDPPQSP